MFGFLRFFLAFLVCVHHLWIKELCFLSHVCVWGFYTLSGFLMTKVISEKYGHTKAGAAAFFKNRFLKIFPLYWLVALVTCILLLFIPKGTLSAFWYNLFLPSSGLMWIKNIFILGLRISDMGVIIPTAWTLSIELLFYIFIYLVASRKFSYTLIWLVAESVLWIFLTFKRGDANHLYFSPFTSGLAFSMGSVAAFLVKEISVKSFLIRFASSYPAVNLFFLVIISAIAGFELTFPQQISYAFMLPVIGTLFAFIVMLLGQSSMENQLLKRTDKLLADLSYPIYLVHLSVGLAFYWFLKLNSICFTLFICSFPVILGVSYILNQYFEQRFLSLKSSLVKP